MKIEGQVSADTTVSWNPAPGAASYRVWWRDTTDAKWRLHKDAGAATSLKLDHVVIDDWFFGVQAMSKDGYASPVVFPGPAGAFVSAAPPKLGA